MSRCPFCAAGVPPDSRFCPSCGGALGNPASDPAADVSFEAHPDPTLRRSNPGQTPSHRAPSGSREPGRFPPGTLLADRYRIVGLLGRGGMGEVYRADDLKLGQTVALKFLPEKLQHDASRLDRLLAEVRLARQVSHPRVCRVYDIGETEGQHFLSMEYVDGENLASLLHRIGRVPEDKAVDIARQICAGLAAAHAQGILHRDLKPANVMLDGEGHVRLTDFGLAALADSVDATDVKAGTPAYMAPEQFAGREVTVRTDVYALGLVLYELFTGRAAFAGGTSDEMLRAREESPPTSPGRIVEGLEPSVERVILRCLESDPRMRPSSALAVAAALPGGDPLAEALAAGELPSPEMVAAGSSEGGLRPAAAGALFVALLLGIALVISQAGKAQLVRMVSLEKSPDVLEERAHEILARVGVTDPPRDEEFGFFYDGPQLSYIARRDSSSDRWVNLAEYEPSVLRFWHRSGPDVLLPWDRATSRPSFDDPPLLQPGMTRLTLDSRGRLLTFAAVPPDPEETDERAPEPDFSPLFEEAGLDLVRFAATTPRGSGPIHSDHRFAWEGAYPGKGNLPIRVEAASARGNPVQFSIVEPWNQRGAAVMRPGSWIHRAGNVVYLVGSLSTLIAGILIARENLRRGRGDRKGALRLALYLLTAEAVTWLFQAHHVADRAELALFFGPLSSSLLWAVGAWILYIALEPLARRVWPHALVTWVRLLNGRLRDPLVGRDCLVGCLLGMIWTLNDLFFQIAPGWWGGAAPRPDGIFYYGETLEVLRGLSQAVAVLLRDQLDGVYMILLYTVFLVVLRALLRRTWLASSVFAAVALVAFSGSSGQAVWDLLAPVIMVTGFLFVFFRFGLLAVVFGAWFSNTIQSLPLTFDFSPWYGERTLAGLVVLVAMAFWAFRTSLGARTSAETRLGGL